MSDRIFDEPVYAAWRLKVYQRDKFKCRACGKSGRGARLQAHHIRRWIDAPDLRYELTNGITLCKRCHDMCKDAEDIYAPLFSQLLLSPAAIFQIRALLGS